MTESKKSIKKFGPPLKSGLKTAGTLKELGVNYCGLSNNHIFDFGIKGVVDTIVALNEAGIVYTGFGKNYEAHTDVWRELVKTWNHTNEK